MKVGVLGLGYVGEPLFRAFQKIEKVQIVGFDPRFRDDNARVRFQSAGCKYGVDFSADDSILEGCEIFIVAVPTPIDQKRRPEFSTLMEASLIVGKYMTRGAIAVYESTVYPGATYEICLPLIEKISRLKLGVDFELGYSPERINPGDPIHQLSNTPKIISASSEFALIRLRDLYELIVDQTVTASRIEVAEAAKVIENIQRDLNIALVNEFSMIFEKLGISTSEVLKIAGTKWNFHAYHPGLVGGHCIGVDPYYLADKAQAVGHYPSVLLAGRALNESMVSYVSQKILEGIIKNKIVIHDAMVLMLGGTFKKNCDDQRNSKALELANALTMQSLKVDMFDPKITNVQLPHFEGNLFTSHEEISDGYYDVVVVAVGHDEFVDLGANRIRKWLKENAIIIDLNLDVFDESEVNFCL